MPRKPKRSVIVDPVSGLEQAMSDLGVVSDMLLEMNAGPRVDYLIEQLPRHVAEANQALKLVLEMIPRPAISAVRDVAPLSAEDAAAIRRLASRHH